MSARFTLRAATVADARGIADVHVDGWRWGYRDILPASLLDALDVEQRQGRWSSMLADPGPAEARVVAVAEEGQIVGFTSTGPADADFATPPQGIGELFAVYVRDGWQGRGVGRALLAVAERELMEAGFRGAVLWVFETNVSARRFYEAGGWQPDGTTGVFRFEDGERAVVRYTTDL